MKTSELITQLQTVLDRQGDLEIYGSRILLKGKLQTFSWQIENHLAIRKQKLYIIFRKMTHWENKKTYKGG